MRCEHSPALTGKTAAPADPACARFSAKTQRQSFSQSVSSIRTALPPARPLEEHWGSWGHQKRGQGGCRSSSELQVQRKSVIKATTGLLHGRNDRKEEGRARYMDYSHFYQLAGVFSVSTLRSSVDLECPIPGCTCTGSQCGGIYICGLGT